MTNLFVYGTLRHMPLLQVVLGTVPETRKVAAQGYAVCFAEGRDFPIIVKYPGNKAEGLLLQGLAEADMARLSFYEGPTGYRLGRIDVVASDGVTTEALAYFPKDGVWQAGARWSFEEWILKWGNIIVATAGDAMALFPDPIAEHRRNPMLVRGSSRVRAEETAPTVVRRSARAGDVSVTERREPYANFFSVEEYDLSFRRFDGTFSPVVTRAAFVSGDAVTVLPYDPVRDRVLVIEQFRTGPFARGDSKPWQLEAIAGRIDPAETPMQAAIREAEEEAGLHLTKLLQIAAYYPSPGAKSEYIYSFLALTDLPDGSAILAGEASEQEDIKGHLISFDDFMALVASGEVATGPLVLTALWLERERPRLRS